MKTFLMVGIAVTLIGNTKSCVKENDLIYWNQYKNLKWSNFEGTAFKTDTLSAGCSIKLKWDYEISKKVIKIRVYSVFSKRESWYKDTSEYALNHEMGHFNIGEILARRLRQKVSEMSGELLDQETIDSIFKEYTNMLFEMQALYDVETNHSIISSEQTRWNKKIQTELDNLKVFENARISIKVRN
jgi:hypothetical protein